LKQPFLFGDSAFSQIEWIDKNLYLLTSSYCILCGYLVSFHPNNLQIIDTKDGVNYVFNYASEKSDLLEWLKLDFIQNETARFIYEYDEKLLLISFHNTLFGRISLSNEENKAVYDGVKNYYKYNNLIADADGFQASGDIFRPYASELRVKLNLELKEFTLNENGQSDLASFRYNQM
jgi:hypothetical protein